MKSVVMRVMACAISICPLSYSQILVDSRRAAELLANLPPDTSNSLKCDIAPVAPSLTFSFHFQTGYVARLPLQQFHGRGHSLSMLVRVTTFAGIGEPVYLLRTYDLPDVPDTELAADLAGGFLLGEGNYQANAILFDDLHRACRADWRMEVKSGRGERGRSLIPPNHIVPFSLANSRPRKADVPAPSKRTTILLHAAPLNPRNIKLQAGDVVTITSALAALLEELPAGAVRLVVFSLHQENELYRSEAFSAGDLEQVTHVLDSLQLGMVDYRLLQHPREERDVLRNLIHREMQEEKPSQDIILLGPDGSYGRDNPTPPADLPAPGQRFFYLQFEPGGPLFAELTFRPSIIENEPHPPLPCQNLSTDPCGSMPPITTSTHGPETFGPTLRRSMTDADAIGGVVRKLKGKVLVVRTPADFAKAVDQVGRPVK